MIEQPAQQDWPDESPGEKLEVKGIVGVRWAIASEEVQQSVLALNESVNQIRERQIEESLDREALSPIEGIRSSQVLGAMFRAWARPLDDGTDEQTLARLREETAQADSAQTGLRQVLFRSHVTCSRPMDWQAALVAETAPSESRWLLSRLHGLEAELESVHMSVPEDRQEPLRRTREDVLSYIATHQTPGSAQAPVASERVLAEGVLAGRPESYVQALAQMYPFPDINGVSLAVEAWPRTLRATLGVFPAEVAYAEFVRVRETGLPDLVNIPDKPPLDEHRLYVCSSVLRVAREVFALLPLGER